MCVSGSRLPGPHRESWKSLDCHRTLLLLGKSPHARDPYLVTRERERRIRWSTGGAGQTMGHGHGSPSRVAGILARVSSMATSAPVPFTPSVNAFTAGPSGHEYRPRCPLADFLGPLSIVISLKYLAVVLRADNQGEGYLPTALATLIVGPTGRTERPFPTSTDWYLLCALLDGDRHHQLIDFQFLAAPRGLSVAETALTQFVVPITVLGHSRRLVLHPQRGTATVGKVFGPVILFWLLCSCRARWRAGVEISRRGRSD